MKRLFLAALIMISSIPCMAQQTFVNKEIDLSQTLASNIAVIGGSLACQPVRTSYGYVAAGDGKQIYGFTQEGRLLWQRTAKFRLKKFISVLSEDLICVVSTDSQIALLNSSGLFLWTSKSDFTVMDEPFQGADGRIFVRGKNYLSCYGMKGTRRWETKTEEQNSKLKPSLLNDGSVVVFLSRMQDGKTVGTRISPFGEFIEEIVFAGQVLSAHSTAYGTALTFSDGSAGLLAIENNAAISKWTIPSVSGILSLPLNVICDRKNDLLYFVHGPSSRIACVETKTGNVISSFDTQIGTSDIKYMTLTSQGVVLCSQSKGHCYKKDGDLAWKVKFDPQKKTKYMFVSDSGYIVLCNSNWTMELYQTRLNLEKTRSSFYEMKAARLKLDESRGMYPSSYEYGRLIEDKELEQISESFSKGDFSEKEKDSLSLLHLEITEMTSQWNRNRSQGQRDSLYFRNNIPYSSSLIETACRTEVYFCRNELISLMKNTSDPSFLLHLVKCAGIAAWDPGEEMLSAIEYLMNTKRVSPKDILLLNEIADTTWEICRFMGRPAYFQKGRQILGYMLYPQFPKEIRDKAVEIMRKIADSKL
ncbi:PQQ-binding-like beta-propeller repeat protein [Treponema sp.]|uniref:outer membrane protein assembly factor BamB family protein n=1 Tax=Treponema sp. TaxID=166 RepID=UPI00298D8BDD|nr:PQQ-binding-like beta-propeller repeat protein [Treponema sp.]